MLKVNMPDSSSNTVYLKDLKPGSVCLIDDMPCIVLHDSKYLNFGQSPLQYIQVCNLLNHSVTGYLNVRYVIPLAATLDLKYK